MEIYLIPVCIVAIVVGVILLTREILRLVREPRPEGETGADKRVVWVVIDILFIIIVAVALFVILR